VAKASRDVGQLLRLRVRRAEFGIVATATSLRSVSYPADFTPLLNET
jgi:hypothetical protein